LNSISADDRVKFVHSVDKQLQSALHKAARRGYGPFSAWLRSKGADSSARDGRGFTAAELAQQSGFTVVAAELNAPITAEKNSEGAEEKH